MNPNTGSFGSAIGGGQEIIAAMQRRGLGAGTMQQTSPASAGGAVVPQMPETASAQAALGGAMGGAAQPQQPQEDSELRIALKALGGFVTSEGKLRRDLATGAGQQGAI